MERVSARLDARLQRGIDAPLALALSGGGDSLALLEMVAGWTQAAGRRLLAITVDHGLSAASGDWSRLCADAATRVGATWIERRWNADKPGTGLPAAARRARHALIADAAREAGAGVVLFAHTADDIAEADWMRAQGSTLGSLREWSPSPAWPEGRGVMVFRPLLRERREALRTLLRARGRDWIEDPGNAGFLRGRARAALDAVRAADRPPPDPSACDRRSVAGGAGRCSPLPLGAGFRTDRSVDPVALSALLLCVSGSDEPPRRARLDTLGGRLASHADFVATLAGARVEAIGRRVTVGREPGEMRRRPVPDLSLIPGCPAVWDGRYEITAPESGWIVSAARGQLNALSRADRAVAGTLPSWARAALPVLIRDGSPAPVLAWRAARVVTLAPRRLELALGETTQECDLYRTIHGETPPSDLF